MILPILQYPDPRLSQICAKVKTVPDGLIEDMFETMYSAPGRGLAAPQVGVMLRLFVIDAGWKDGDMRPIVMINPKVQWASEELVTHEEGCLSIPDTPRRVARPAEVRFRWTDLSGKAVVETLFGTDAVCAQHEMDHLDGRLILDHPEAA